MAVDLWQQVGMVCGALIALLTLVGLVWTKGIRPMWRSAWRILHRLDQVADDILGDRTKGKPSIVDYVRAVDGKLTEHLNWHSDGGRSNGDRPGPHRRGEHR